MAFCLLRSQKASIKVFDLSIYKSNLFKMKKTNIFMPTLLLVIFSNCLKAQSHPPAMQFWNLVMIPYNSSFDMSYNLSIDIIHSSSANRQQLLKNIDLLDKTTQSALKVYSELPSDLLPEYEKLRKNATLAIKTMRVLLDFDNLKAQELAATTNLSSREALQRMMQSERLSSRLDSIQRSFTKDIQAYAQSNKIRIIESDSAEMFEKKKVAEFLGYSSDIYIVFLESKIPLEDFLNALKLEDTTALVKARKELIVQTQTKMKLLDGKRANKATDALFLEMERILKTLKTFSEKPSEQLITLMTTAPDKRTQEIVDNFNATIKDINTIYLPSLNTFNQKYSEYKQKNVKPRKTKYEAVQSD
jgi:hypothetical protein